MTQTASFITINTREEFSRQLELEPVPVEVVADTIFKFYHEIGKQGVEAKRLFDTLLQPFPYNLDFRAFNDRVEYAWYGSEGLKIQILDGAAGQYQVENVEFAGMNNKLRGRGQNITSLGKIIYQKLMSYGAP